MESIIYNPYENKAETNGKSGDESTGSEQEEKKEEVTRNP